MEKPIFFTTIEYFFLIYFTSINLIYTFLVILGSIKTYFRCKELEEDNFSSILQSNVLPEITFIIPMYNESKVITENIESILHLSYRYKKIILINDGSTDDSIDILIKAFDLVSIPKFYVDFLDSKPTKGVYQSKSHQELIILDKEHGKKFDAVNAGINACTTSFLIVVDADTFIDNSGFEALIRPFLTNPKTIGVGASIRIKNGCLLNYNRISTSKFPKSYLASLQGIEYIRSFLSRVGWNYFNGNFIISGAFSLFSRDLLVKVGGFCDSVGEDVEIVIRLHRFMKETKTSYKLFYIPDPIAWTTAPEQLHTLAKQRTRWQLALLESLYHHKRMFFNPRYRLSGFIIYPFWVLGEALEPLIEALGCLYILFSWYFDTLHLQFLVFYLALSFGLIFLYTFYSLLVDDINFQKYPSLRSAFLMFFTCLIENIGYHQLSLYWKLKGYYQFIKRLPELRKESRNIQAKMTKGKNL